MKRTMLTFLLKLPRASSSDTDNAGQCVLKTIRNLFRVTSTRIGGISTGCADDEFLGNIKNASFDLKKLKKYGCGTLDRKLYNYVGNLPVGTSWKQLKTAESNIQIYQQQNQATDQQEGFAQYLCGIPLYYFLNQELIPGSVLYNGLGQSIQIILANVDARVCLANGELAAAMGQLNTGGYDLTNIGLVKVYSKLTTEIDRKIQSVSLQMPFLKYETYPLYAVTPTCISIFSIGRQDRIRRVLLSLNPIVAGNQVTGVYGSENIITQGAAGFSSLHYPMAMISMPVLQVEINCGGFNMVFSQQQLQQQHRLGSAINGQEITDQHPLAQQLNQPVILDVSRWQDDVVGAMGLESSVQIQIKTTFAVDGKTKTIFNQASPWSNSPSGAGVCTIKDYVLYAFLEIQTQRSLEYGIYK